MRWLLKLAIISALLCLSCLVVVDSTAQTWSAPTNISNNPGNSHSPAIAIDVLGNPHVVWADKSLEIDPTSNKAEIFYSHWDSVSWSNPTIIFNTSGNSGSPAIAIDSSGNVHVVWSDNTPGNYEIVHSHKLAELPLPITPTTSPTITSSTPTPIFAVAGTVTNPDGSKAAKDLEVIAENEAKGLKNKSNVGEQGEGGKYTIAFVNFENKIVASTGDILRITVKNPAGEVLASQTYQITSSDIDKRVAIVNIKIPKPSPTTSISKITVSGSPAKIGSKITVTTTASPGAIATFSISNIPRAIDIQMKEITPGTYSGEYEVVSGDNATNTIVTVSLKTKDGAISKSSEDKITVDTIPPASKELGISVITLLLEPLKTKLNETVKVQGQLILVGEKLEAVAKQPINLTYTPPKGDPIFQKVETDSSGIYKAELKIKDEASFIGNWKATAQWQGNDKYKSSQQTFEFEVEKGYYLSPSLKQTEAIDKPTSVSSLEFAITQWAAKQVSKHVPLLIYLLSHNLDDKFLLEKQGNREVILTSEKLGEWLDQLPEGTPVTLIIEACHSECKREDLYLRREKWR